MPDKAAASPLTLAVDRSGAAAVVRCSGRLVSGVNDLLYVQVQQLIRTANGLCWTCRRPPT